MDKLSDVRTHVLPWKPQPHQGASAPLNPTISPSRPQTSSSEAIGRSRARLEVGERRLSSGDRTTASSPVWKHAMSACAHVTPLNVVVVATVGSVPAVKEKEKDKEKMGLIKRLASGGKAKKRKPVDSGSYHPLGDTSISHSRSGSFPSDLTVYVAPDNAHRKMGSFDATSSPNLQQKPARLKPPVKEKFRCTETYPAQTELELDLKVGDIIFVSKKRDDGWYKGTLQRTGKTGLFQGSFVVKY